MPKIANVYRQEGLGPAMNYGLIKSGLYALFGLVCVADGAEALGDYLKKPMLQFKSQGPGINGSFIEAELEDLKRRASERIRIRSELRSFIENLL